MKHFFFSLFLVTLAGAGAQAADRFNTNQPIEINADSLEVYQEESRAIFIGNVVAVQGEVRLKADKMTVHYSQAKEGKSAGEKSAIERLEVVGNVFLSTPEETASGASGLYDVAGREIRLKEKVVLTRGKNVLKGDHLVYNLNTGKSVIDSSGAAVDSVTGKKQRVRALFVPGEEKK